ncbi:hypothetical protein D3C81_716940 [compost metagenome]
MADQGFQQGVVEHLLAGQGAALGRQRLVLECLELRGDEALGALEGLAADVVARCLFGLPGRQLDEIAVYAVVADFEVGQTRAGFFAGFEIDQELAGVLAHGQQLVQLVVVAGLEHAAVANDRWRVIDDRPLEQAGQLRVGPGDGCQARQVRRLEFGHGVLQFRQSAQRIPQARQVTGACVAQTDTGEDPLEVADFLELRLQLLEAVAVEQAADRILTRLQHLEVAQWAVQPASQ